MDAAVAPVPALPAVSVVVAAYNAEAYLRACIDSVLAQEGVDVEVIAVDDGSTDGTARILEAYGDAITRVRQPNSGGCSAPRNRGARLATCPLLTFFDADDVMVQGKLAAQADALRTHPDAGGAVTDYRNFDDREGTRPHTHFQTCTGLAAAIGEPVRARAVELAPADVRRLLLREHFSIAGSPMFRRELFLALGGFDETLQASEDYDLLYRIALRAPVVVVPRVGFHRRLHAANMTARAVHMFAQQARSRANLARLEPDPALARELRRVSRRFRLALAEALGRRGDARSALAALRGAYPALASRDGMRALAWSVAGPLVRRMRGLPAHEPP